MKYNLQQGTREKLDTIQHSTRHSTIIRYNNIKIFRYMYRPIVANLRGSIWEINILL